MHICAALSLSDVTYTLGCKAVRGNLEYSVQRHFRTWNGGARDRTTNPLVRGWLPKPQPSKWSWSMDLLSRSNNRRGKTCGPQWRWLWVKKFKQLALVSLCSQSSDSLVWNRAGSLNHEDCFHCWFRAILNLYGHLEGRIQSHINVAGYIQTIYLV